MYTCHVLSRPLSQATATMQFIKAEVEAGMRPTVVCPAGPPSFLEEYPEVTIINLPTQEIVRFSIKMSWEFISMVIDALRGQTFDVVIVYDFRGCGLLPIRGQKISKTWLLNIRNSNLRSSGMRAKLADRVTGLETRSYKTVIVCDAEIGHRLLGKRSFQVLPNGVDLQKFAEGERDVTREQLGYSKMDVVITCVGALTMRRRPARMLEAFAKVVKAHPEARLLMVGNSDNLAELEAWARGHQLADRITFTGRVPYHEIQNYLAATDIGFAYYPKLATYDGNLPLKTSEFLAAGLPTVATKTPGNQFYIRDEENGLLAEDEPDELAKAMLRLFDEPELVAHLRHNARSSVIQYDWGNLVNSRLLPLYT